jgi:hypothetical protein
MGKGGHLKSGPAPRDADEREARGGRTRQRHRDLENVVVPIGVPIKPTRLGAYGSREWTRLSRLLAAEGRLSPSDRPCLAIAAGVYQAAREIQVVREKEVAGTEGWLRLMRAERLQWQLFEKALGDLCLTPATRARAPRPPKKVGSGLDNFLRRKHGL